MYSLCFFFFSFPFPLLCRLNFLLLVWKLYILVAPSHLFGPIPYLITVLGLKSLSTILPFSALFTCAGPVTSSGRILCGDSSPFPLPPCLELGWLLQGSPGRDSPAQQEQEVLCMFGGWWVPRRREREDGALRALPQGWEPQTFWSSSTVCLWDFYSLLPASLSDAVHNGVLQPTKGGKQMRGGSLGKMIGRGRD